MQTLPFHLRIGQLLVGDGFQTERLRRVDHSSAERQGEPLSFSAAQVGRHGLLEHSGLHRLRQALVGQVEEVAEVDRHQHVRGRLRPLGGDTLGQPVLDEDRIDLDARGLGERVEEGLNQSGFAGGIEVYLLSAGRDRNREQQRRKSGRAHANHRTTHHVQSLPGHAAANAERAPLRKHKKLRRIHAHARIVPDRERGAFRHPGDQPEVIDPELHFGDIADAGHAGDDRPDTGSASFEPEVLRTDADDGRPRRCARRRGECAQRSHERAALDRALDGIHVPEDTRHLRRARTLIDIRRSAELHETALRRARRSGRRPASPRSDRA